MKNLAVSISLFIFLTVCGYGQDVHFSQYQKLETYLNPGMAGIFEGRQKVTGIYRDQWSSLTQSVPFRSIGLSAQFRYKVYNEDYWTFHFQLINDKVGGANFSQTSGVMGLSYSKKLFQFGRKKWAGHFLSFGAQGGFAQHSINWSRLWFGNQFDVATESINLDPATSGESFLLLNTGRSGYFLDLNAGLFWYAMFDERKVVFAGIAGHHLNQANISVLQSVPGSQASSLLYDRKWAVNTGANWEMNRNLEIRPRLTTWLQNNLLNFNFGNSFVYHSDYMPDFHPKLGLFFRLVKADTGGDNGERLKTKFDSFIIALGAEIGSLDVNLSYDFTISELNDFNRNRGAVELVVSYTIGLDEKRGHILTPRF